GNERVLRRVQQLAQRKADGEDEGKHLETVERPAEVRSDEGFPLRPVERAIPRRRPDDAGVVHDSLPCNIRFAAGVVFCFWLRSRLATWVKQRASGSSS